MSFGRPARDAFLAFAQAAPWRANFRDFSAAIRRMATLSEGGRIDPAGVAAEIARLDAAALSSRQDDGLAALLGPRADELDRFDRVQLADVVAVCGAAPSLSAAGRSLFAHSLAGRTTRNDADRLRKYLARFGLEFDAIRGAPPR